MAAYYWKASKLTWPGADPGFVLKSYVKIKNVAILFGKEGGGPPHYKPAIFCQAEENLIRDFISANQ